MATSPLRRYLSLLLVFLNLLSCFSMPVFAEETFTEPTAETTEYVQDIPEDTTEPSEECTEATEVPSDPTEASTLPSEEPADPTEDSAGSAEEPTEPAEESVDPTEESTLPSEEAAEPTEEPAEPTEPVLTENPILFTAAAPEDAGPQLYFGRLHAHSDLSSGTDSPEDLFQTAAEAGLDFLAITDHSDAFDNAASGNLTEDCAAASQAWAKGKAAAGEKTTENFLGIYGFEMSWPERMQLGHISVFHTSGFQSWNQEAYQKQASALENFYETLSAAPGAIGQFSHPGLQYGTFSSFEDFSEEADGIMQLLEVSPAESIGLPSGYDYYTRALDKGWHVAPTISHQESDRTVILAQSLTEEALYDALDSRRVYATEDSDLEIYYTMDGYALGSVLKKRHVGQTADIVASLYDPSDDAIGLVEVIAGGGETVAEEILASNAGTLAFSLPADEGYYYLRITQPDGQIAVTAPIWVEGAENLGISGLVCETAVPVQGEPLALALGLYNREDVDFLVESLTILADDVIVAKDSDLTRIPAGSEVSCDLSFLYNGIGQTEITVSLCGTLEGAPREYEQMLTLSFRQSGQVTDIVIDGSHGNAGLASLGVFKSLAAGEDIRVTVAGSGITETLLEDCRFLVVTAPTQPFSEAFLAAAAEYIGYGGSILLCGQSRQLDGDFASAEELNRLLEAVGSAMRLNSDAVTDSLYNGGDENLLYPEDILSDSPWLKGLTDGQVYRHAYGCSVLPGNGSTLVTTQGTAPATVLAAEETDTGGTILAAGCLLIGNTELAEPSNIWDAPYANRTVARNLLGIGGEALPLSTIQQAREAAAGTVLRIRGYVTAGTSNPYNRFPDTLYIQDDTGGIAVIPFTGENIAVGTPVEITGAAELREGNRILKTVSWEVLSGNLYKYLPQTGDWKTLLDPELHGGELVEVEGTCTKVSKNKDGIVTGITLKDSSENTARILVEDYIFSGATGENTLHEDIQTDSSVRAVGLLHTDEKGNAVIRVRNCEEVVCVPPRKVYVNPKTGDSILLPAVLLAASAAELILLKKKKQTK